MQSANLVWVGWRIQESPNTTLEAQETIAYDRLISTKPRRLITVRTGVLFNRTLSRLSRREVGTARHSRSARERATATCEAGAPRRVTSIFLVGPVSLCRTLTFGGVELPKQKQAQSSGWSELAMQPQPFLQDVSHSPAEHFAIVHP